MLRQAFQHILDGDQDVLGVMWRTIFLALESTGLALVIGLPVAYMIAGGRSRGQRIGLVLANAGLGLPPVVLGIYLALALLPGSLLGHLNWTYTLNAIVLAQALLALPVVVALGAAAIRALPGGLLDQARIYGASHPQLAMLALREARVGVMAAVIVALGYALAEVGAVVIVGGNIRGQTNTLASTVLLDLAAGDPASATANIIVLLTLVLALGVLLTAIQHGGGDRSAGTRRPRRGTGGGASASIST